MLAVTASRFSPSDMWRKPKEEGSRDRPILGSWRERRVSQESGEVKGILGNWRVREQKEAPKADLPEVCGGSMPPEWKLQRMYKPFKVDNAEFTTWLVESVYPSLESLPFYITLSDKQAKDFSKYDIIVNKTTELARQPRKVPRTMVALLDRLIPERAEYTYWMSQKSTDERSHIINESHLYYIEVLKETRAILAEGIEPEATVVTYTELLYAKLTNNTLGKRKPSSTTHHGWEQNKAAKTEATTPTPLHIFKGANPAAAAEKTQRAQWRQIVAKNCNSTTDNTGAAANKPMSNAAATRAVAA